MTKIDGNKPKRLEYTKKEYIKYLNEIGESLSDDEFIIGGKMRPRRDNYGKMMYLFDKVTFEVGYSDWERENKFKNGEL